MGISVSFQPSSSLSEDFVTEYYQRESIFHIVDLVCYIVYGFCILDSLPTSYNNPTKTTFKLDVTNLNNVKDAISQFNPSIIINCSAYTDVDKAEKNGA